MSLRAYAAIVALVASGLFGFGVYAHGNSGGGWTSYSPTPPGSGSPVAPPAAKWWWVGAGAALLLGVALAPLTVRELRR
jgi:hypothetical protein